jgi:hypothetical protein
MASTAPEWLWIVEESAWGVPVASPVVNTSQFLVPLIDSNAFSMVEQPVFNGIAFGGGFDVEADYVVDQRECKGSLSTLGYPALAAFLHQAAVTRINTGQTLPWVTTEAAGDLASFSIYHQIRQRNGTIRTYAYPACKVMGLDVSISRQDPKLKIKLDLQAKKELPNAFDSSAALTAPTAPVDTDYPRGPYVFSHTSTRVKFATVAFAQYDELSYSIKNKMDPKFFEDRWLQINSIKGRESTADLTSLLKTSPDFRALLQVGTRQAFEIGFGNGTSTLKVDFSGKVYANKASFDLGLGKEFMDKVGLMTQWDASASADVVITST